MKRNRLFFSASLALLASMMVACGGGGGKTETEVARGANNRMPRRQLQNTPV